MVIVDGHLDLAWNALDLGRDLSASLETIRTREGPHPAHGEGTATVCLPALRQAGVQVVLGTIYVSPTEADGTRRTPEVAHRHALAQLAYYEGLAERGEITLIRSRGELAAAEGGGSPAPGVVLLLEGADALPAPDDLPAMAARGVRIVGPAWRRTRYAGGTGEPGPLTSLGRELLAVMAGEGVALDVSHLAEEAFWEAANGFPGPLLASHANCRALVPGDRQLSDAMCRTIADRAGVIGLVLYNRFLRAGWTAADGKAAVRLDEVVAHANHLRELVGSAHIGLGSDLDGGVGREVIPAELDSIADLPKLATALAQAGYAPAEQTAVMGENWLRWLRRVLPE
jgi:membrane dipeptidase